MARELVAGSVTWRALRLLSGSRLATPRALAPALGVHPSRVAAALRQIEAAGLVTLVGTVAECRAAGIEFSDGAVRSLASHTPVYGKRGTPRAVDVLGSTLGKHGRSVAAPARIGRGFRWGVESWI